MKRKIGTVLISLMFLIGLMILSYPIVSNWLATRSSAIVADQYDRMTSSLSPDQIEEEWEKAQKYNDHLRGDPVEDPFVKGSGRALMGNYMDVLSIEEVMAYVEVPVANIKLPIYHGVEEDVLEKGVGHISTTALPIGGIGGHSVLTGHTGLPTAKLFTDLTMVKEGDFFYIHVLGKKLIYEVDQIKVIDPDDITELIPYDDKDYITLLTCTPYGINSHRLLVRGERSYRYSDVAHLFKDKVLYLIGFWSVIVIIILLILSIIIERIILRKRKRKEEKA